MATQKMIVSNRRNALKSTGPKTQEGKFRASANAVTHGLLSKKILLEGEDQSEFEVFSEQTFLALQPVDELESILTSRIVETAWRLRRAATIERDLLKRDELDSWRNSLSDLFSSSTNQFAILSRYETAIERSLYRALHELQRIQGQRQGLAVPLPIAIDIQADTEGNPRDE